MRTIDLLRQFTIHYPINTWLRLDAYAGGSGKPGLAFHRMEPAGAERHRRDARRVSLLAQTNQTPYNLPMRESKPLVAIIMGSKSDWETMRHATEMLDDLGVPNEARVLSAHRTPEATADFARKAAERGLQVIIAGAGGAAHLAGVIAAHTWLPVLGVPIQSKLQGLDSLLSTAQMPGGIPVGTLAIGEAGAKNAALLAAAILATSDKTIRQKLEAFRKNQSEAVLAAKLPK
jgi:5-(carboxyamino)imidazole ribonucleotide mutase